MVVKKIESDFGLDIHFEMEDGTLQIYYGGNLDLYWTFWPMDYDFQSKDERIVISEEDEVYFLFDTLYNDIKNCSFSSRKKRLKQTDEYRLLYQNGIICWHSDEQVFEDANSVSILKENNQIVIEFDFQNKDMCLENSIRFRNRGSRYTPFNQAFMKHYQSLCETDFKVPEEPKLKVK